MTYTLTARDMQALQSYAAEHGRYWKSRLRDDWANCRAVGDRDVQLYRLRNLLGPTWLTNYRLKREVA